MTLLIIIHFITDVLTTGLVMPSGNKKRYIKGKIKYEVEEHWGPNFLQSFANYSSGNLFLR